MKKEIAFVWLPEHGKAFQELQQVITNAQVLTYYDTNKENIIQSDARQKDRDVSCYRMESLSAIQVIP